MTRIDRLGTPHFTVWHNYCNVYQYVLYTGVYVVYVILSDFFVDSHVVCVCVQRPSKCTCVPVHDFPYRRLYARWYPMLNKKCCFCALYTGMLGPPLQTPQERHRYLIMIFMAMIFSLNLNQPIKFCVRRNALPMTTLTAPATRTQPRCYKGNWKRSCSPSWKASEPH